MLSYFRYTNYIYIFFYLFYYIINHLYINFLQYFTHFNFYNNYLYKCHEIIIILFKIHFRNQNLSIDYNFDLVLILILFSIFMTSLLQFFSIIILGESLAFYNDFMIFMLFFYFIV